MKLNNPSIPCPHCQKPTLSWWQKYLAAKWALVYCSECKGRSCSSPIILVFFTMLYVWDVMLFGFLAYLDQNLWYLLALVVFWLILDYFSLYLPLRAMKPSVAQKADPTIEDVTEDKLT